jgi:hypothetical protein
MGWRYRKSVRLSPGVRLNLSKGRPSVSIGRPGATLNLGRRGVNETFGIPGSGLSYSSRSSGGAALIGLFIASFFALLVSAARGNRAAQVALILLGAGTSYLYITSSTTSERPNQVEQTPSQPAAGPHSTLGNARTLEPAVTSSIPSIAQRSTALLASPTAAAVPSSVGSPVHMQDSSTRNGPGPIVFVITLANVRSGPAKTSEVVGQVHLGEGLSIFEVSGSWAHVERNNTVIGWVHRSLLSDSDREKRQ